MTSAQGTVGRERSEWLTLGFWRRIMRDYPLIPLLILLGVLLLILHTQRPGIINQVWLANTLKAAIPLAILAASQTLTMLTGGIDLSVAAVASMAAFVMTTQTPLVGPVLATVYALAAAALTGFVTGLGVGVLRVHPLIMTLGMGLVVLGFMTVYQRDVLSSGSAVPDEFAWLGAGTTEGLPNSLLLIVPLAALIIYGLRRFGYGRLLYAVGDNETAARLSGVRVWQVLLALYIISALLAAVAGFMYAGLIRTVSLDTVNPFLLPSVAAAVIGGTSIFGGRGGYAGTLVGALILTVLGTLLIVLNFREEAYRQILFGAIVLGVAAAYTRITSSE